MKIMIIEIHSPEVEAKILAQAQARGVSVEALIASAIEGLNGVTDGEDPRIADMREAVNDPLFMADLRESMEDFKYVDAEFNH